MAANGDEQSAQSSATGRKTWDDRLNDAGARAEQELRRVVRFIDEEVVPDVRRNGSLALRRAAAELEKLARSLDDYRGGGPAAKP